MSHYFRLWLASVRYSLVRAMMFRFDFILWASVELAWMGVNLALINVIYGHVEAIAGWNKHQMLLLIGTSMLIQRLLMGFFWSNLFEMGRNVRSGTFDFYLTQPGEPLFMVSTRKLDPDSLINSVVAIAVIVYAVRALGLEMTAAGVGLYVVLLFLGLIIHYSALLMLASTTFWIIKTEGIEGSYFTLFEFSRLPRASFKNLATQIVFVYALPAVIVTNVPAATLLHGPSALDLLWVAGLAVAWFTLAVWMFHRGLRRYTSASS